MCMLHTGTSKSAYPAVRRRGLMLKSEVWQGLDGESSCRPYLFLSHHASTMSCLFIYFFSQVFTNLTLSSKKVIGQYFLFSLLIFVPLSFHFFFFFWETVQVFVETHGFSLLGFPHNSVGKDSASNAGDPGSIPVSGRSAGAGIEYPLQCSWASLVSQLVNNPSAMRETWVQSLVGKIPWGRERKATHSSILAWRISWTK